MLQRFKYDYINLFPSDSASIFNLMISDFSWAMIHAVLEVFNLERVNEFSQRVFNLASNKTTTGINADKLFVGSCCSHTMNRFCKQVKQKIKFQASHNKSTAICSFSLLLNCIDLTSSDAIFELMLWVFLSPSKITQFEAEKNSLFNLIEITTQA